MALCSRKALGSDKESMSKLELSSTPSEASAMAELWQIRQRSGAGGVGLRELSVIHSHLTKSFAASVFRGKAWPSLERLYLQYNSLTDDGVEMLAACVIDGRLPVLHTLNLAGNNIGNTGAAALADAINNKNSHLRNVYLYDNNIGDLGAEALAQCCVATLAGNPLRNLRELFIWGNKFSEAGKDMIGRARHDGLLMWIDLISDGPDKKNETKNGRKNSTPARLSVTSDFEEGYSPSVRKNGMNTDDRGTTFYEMGHSSLQPLQSEPKSSTTTSGHFWTPRRAPRKLNQDLTEKALFSTTKANNGFATTTSRNETATPKESPRLVMVPMPSRSVKARKGRFEGKGVVLGKTSSPSIRNSHRMPNELETRTSPATQSLPSAPTNEPSFKFKDLLTKAKAMDPPLGETSLQTRTSPAKQSPPSAPTNEPSFKFKDLLTKAKAMDSPRGETSTETRTSPARQSPPAPTNEPSSKFKDLLTKAKAMGSPIGETPIEPRTSPARQSPPSAPTNEPSFKFRDLLTKAKATDSPIGETSTRLSSSSYWQITCPGTAATIPVSQVKTERRVSSAAQSFKSPMMSTDSLMKKTTPRQKESGIKLAKSSTHASPTSPVGEYRETALLMNAQSSSGDEHSLGNCSFQTLLDKARSLEKQNTATPAPKVWPTQKTIQVPFFVPDLEGSDLIVSSVEISPDKHEDAATQSRKQHHKANNSERPPSQGDDSPQCSSPSFRQLRNHFEAKSTAVGTLSKC